MPRGPGERQVWRSLNGHEGESRIQIKADLKPPLAVPGGQGVHREVESEGHEEKYRAVIDGGHPEDERVGQRWGQVEPALCRRRRSPSPTAPRGWRTARYGRGARDL